MIIGTYRQVDLLYALFLGRMPESNFVREDKLGQLAFDIAREMIECDEFQGQIFDQFMQRARLPHRSLSLALLPEVLQLITDAELAPPYQGAAVWDWQAILARVLGATPLRPLLGARYGSAGEQFIARLGGTAVEPIELSESANEAPRTAEPVIVAGAELVANTICRGWIVDRSDPDRLLHVRIKLNGRTVGVIAADEFRRDVQELYGGNGHAGFTLRFDRLPGAQYLSRGLIEITDFGGGTAVLPARLVEFSPAPAIHLEAELRDDIRLLNECLERFESVYRNLQVTDGICAAEAAPVKPVRGTGPVVPLEPIIHAELEGIRGVLSRLEEQLPIFQRAQCWPLRSYDAVRPLAPLLLEPSPCAKRTSFCLLVLDFGAPEDAETTLDSALAETHETDEILWVSSRELPARTDTALERVSQTALQPDEGACIAVNRLAERVSGSHLVILNPGLTLAPKALRWFEAVIARTQAPIIYSDAEILVQDDCGRQRLQPLFRPAFDYDLLLQRNYIGDTFCIETRAYLELAGLSAEASLDPCHDLLLRAVARYGRGAIFHIPQVLFQGRTEPPQQRDVERRRDNALRTVQRHLAGREARPGGPARLALASKIMRVLPSGRHAHAVPLDDEFGRAVPDVAPHDDEFGRAVPDALKIIWPNDDATRIGVIIPTRDSADMVFALLSSLRHHATRWDLVEVIVVVNGQPKEPARYAFAEIQRNFTNARIWYRPGPFNWSEINNAAVRRLSGKGFLLFLNDDMICLTKDWDARLRGQLARPGTGVVGGRLLYPNGIIQHAGISFAQDGSTAHEAMGDKPDDGLYLDRTLLVHEIGAVTGAFLACSRRLFETLGGFDAQRYAMTSGDADFCVRVRASGKSVIYDPFQTWIHYESVSRGRDEHDPGKQARADAEHDLWLERFSALDRLDLSVNPHLARSVRPFVAFQRPDRDAVELWFDAQIQRRQWWQKAASGSPTVGATANP